MPSRRLRTAFLVVLPLVFAAYACTSDEPDSAGPAAADGGAGEDGSASPSADGSATPKDASGPTPDAGPDAGDAGLPSDAGDAGSDGGPALTCIGNPLLPDGGADAGIVVSFDGGALRPIATGQFLDGPQWIDDDAGGAIVYSEAINQAIVRNDPDGGSRVVLRTTAADELPIGNGVAGGFIYTAMARTAPSTGGLILRMGLDGGDPTAFDASPGNSPNDLVGSSKGFVYFTDPGFQTNGISTGIYRLSPDGGITTISQILGGNADRADGIAMTEDGSTLYVGFFDAKKIRRYTVDANGTASDPQDFTFVPTDNPTGLAVDVGGNLWIAENDAVAVSGRIEVVDPAGTKWAEIPFPDARPTGIAFGGAGGKTVYITTERGLADGTLYVLESHCAGVR